MIHHDNQAFMLKQCYQLLQHIEYKAARMGMEVIPFKWGDELIKTWIALHVEESSAGNLYFFSKWYLIFDDYLTYLSLGV